MISKIFLLVEQICPGTSQIYNLGASVAIFLQAGAFEAVKSVTDPLTAADDTFVLVVAEGAFVANADEGSGSDVRVADWAFTVALVAKTTEGDAGCFATHDEIGMVARHVRVCRSDWC